MFRIIVTGILFIQVAFTKVIHQSPIIEGRIVGGQDATLGQFPHQVSLRSTDNVHYCGGSILNSNWILTAGHCTYGKLETEIIAVVGALTLSNGGVTHECSEVITHDDYTPFNLKNDVAVIKTATPMSIGSDSVQAIPLINQFIDEGVLQVSGWGNIQHEGLPPDTLQWLTTHVVPNEVCKKKMPINDDTICALVSRGHGTCSGDSGGPLILPGEGQVGINSFVRHGCGFGFPDGFASVYYHRDWIISHTSE